MGILDEAIREHLELKRRRGATDSELQRLEDEAFGLPSRPGEPDFPEHEGGEPAEQSGNGLAREDAVAEASVAPESHVPPLPEGERSEPAGESDEQDAAEAQTAIYDPGGGELEVGELDLEGEVEEPAREPVAPEEPLDPEASEPPIEALDTVEHELSEHDAEPGAAPSEEPLPEQASESQDPGAPAESEKTSEETESGEEEDVLADTPEFLRDAPEDDELWFEQGKPKDFDF
jgi:hypothetical protein